MVLNSTEGRRARCQVADKKPARTSVCRRVGRVGCGGKAGWNKAQERRQLGPPDGVLQSSIWSRNRIPRVPITPVRPSAPPRRRALTSPPFFVPFSAISAPLGLEMRDSAGPQQHAERGNTPKLLAVASRGPGELGFGCAGQVVQSGAPSIASHRSSISSAAQVGSGATWSAAVSYTYPTWRQCE